MISHDEGATWEDEAYYVYAPGVTATQGEIGNCDWMAIHWRLPRSKWLKVSKQYKTIWYWEGKAPGE